ncbi:hypothetical protein LG634_22900 [Streptomyces bambusae]|uniref:hypothetical protein n=1 Tax=Streptomyces bambusae TaxID=1550616 RepID=UPI001CFE995E|nr:hypothetical protein [Streptomyces bambusae]MCB5167666.1 hypothetical protein [Streptomyces bambusae]
MTIRSAVTSSVLAVGMLLGGAGAAVAHDGFDIDYFNGGHAGFSSDCKTIAAVPHMLPAFNGPIYGSTCAKSGEVEWAKGTHVGS